MEWFHRWASMCLQDLRIPRLQGGAPTDSPGHLQTAYFKLICGRHARAATGSQLKRKACHWQELGEMRGGRGKSPVKNMSSIKAVTMRGQTFEGQ